jgi:hypothetical protein
MTRRAAWSMKLLLCAVFGDGSDPLGVSACSLSLQILQEVVCFIIKLTFMLIFEIHMRRLQGPTFHLFLKEIMKTKEAMSLGFGPLSYGAFQNGDFSLIPMVILMA